MLAFRREENKLMLRLAENVKSGDSENAEAQAAVYYWKKYFPSF
jgi:CRISPR-associated protein Cas1